MSAHFLVQFSADNWREEWREMAAADRAQLPEPGRRAHQLYSGLVEAFLEFIMEARKAGVAPDLNDLGGATGQAFFTACSFVSGPLLMPETAQAGFAALTRGFMRNLAVTLEAETVAAGRPN